MKNIHGHRTPSGKEKEGKAGRSGILNSTCPGIILLLCLFLAQCGGLPHRDSRNDNGVNSFPYSSGHEYRAQIRSLQKELAALDKGVSDEEALLVADAAFRVSLSLANEYDLVRPPLYHNFLVNLGIKKRGLCIHWTRDLLKNLRRLDQKSFHFYWAVANREFPLIIHSSVVVTARNQPFEEGLVLDPWRNSGRLYWTPLKEDRYPWQQEIL